MKKLYLFVLVAIYLSLCACGSDSEASSTSSESSVSLLESETTEASESSPHSEMISSESKETSLQSSVSKKQAVSAIVSSSASATAAPYPTIEADSSLNKPASVIESGNYIYLQNQYKHKNNLIRIDIASKAVKEITTFPVGNFLLNGNKIYYSAKDSNTGKTGLYEMPEAGGNSVLLNNNQVFIFYIYKNHIYCQSKESSTANDYKLFRMDMNGKGITNLGSGNILTIFKDMIYYNQGSTIYSMTTDRKEINALYNHCLVYDVRPDALYYFKDHPSPRGMEIWKRTPAGTAAKLCSAPGYMFEYTADDYLIYTSDEGKSVSKMRLDGSGNKKLVDLPENCYNHIVTNRMLYTWEYTSTGDFYFCWLSFDGNASGKVFLGNDKNFDSSLGEQTEPPRFDFTENWSKPYNVEDIFAECRDFAAVYNYTLVLELLPPSSTLYRKVSTAEWSDNSRKTVMTYIMTCIMAGQKSLGMYIEADGQNPGEYNIYVIY